MKQLTIRLGQRHMQDSHFRSTDRGLLPVKVLDEDGSILADCAAGLGPPTELTIPETARQVFVKLTWPSGRTETQRISLDGRQDADVTFVNEALGPSEWSAWAIPRLNARTPLATAREEIDLDLTRFDKVWLRLWRRQNGRWEKEPLRPNATYRNGAAWQLDLNLERAAWLLQLGGSNVPWRFVSMPGGGPVRVLFTPSDSKDPRSEPLKVVVTSFHSDAETLMEFLARDSMRAADALVSSQSLASQVFADNFDDPISAVAGAYYLLRRGSWDRKPRFWYEKLSREFGWLPDTSLLHCVRLLREGVDADSSHETPYELFAKSLQQGWPVFEEGISLLQEAAAALGQQSTVCDSDLCQQAQALASAKSWAGAATSFYGRQPDDPTALQWVGMPHAPRRRRLHPLLSSERRNKNLAKLGNNAEGHEDAGSTMKLNQLYPRRSRGLASLSPALIGRDQPRSSKSRGADEFLLGNIKG